nr:hypothetical protein [uncultured Actinoplanes sp.]
MEKTWPRTETEARTTVGAVLRTQRYRLPETTRAADRACRDGIT